MTVTKIRSNAPPVKGLLARGEEFLKPLIRAALQEVLEAELTEALGAEKGERTEGRLDKGGIRWQFHHVIDIVPTILEVTGIPAPVMVDGIAQKPIEGVSLAHTFDKANAGAPSPHHTQYFEMMGVQGLYNDGWMLSAVPIRPPWELLGKAILDPTSAFKFELYDVRHDWTQYTDVTAQNPEKMREMTDLMFGEFRSTLRWRPAW